MTIFKCYHNTVSVFIYTFFSYSQIHYHSFMWRYKMSKVQLMHWNMESRILSRFPLNSSSLYIPSDIHVLNEEKKILLIYERKLWMKNINTQMWGLLYTFSLFRYEEMKVFIGNSFMEYWFYPLLPFCAKKDFFHISSLVQERTVIGTLRKEVVSKSRVF